MNRLTTANVTLLRYLQQGLDNKPSQITWGLALKRRKPSYPSYRQSRFKAAWKQKILSWRNPQILGTPGYQGVTRLPYIIPSFPTAFPFVVDDNARYRKQLLRMIGRVNPRTTIYEANSIQETLQIIQNVDPQLALVDVVLGDEDGIACVRQIKAIHPHSRIVLISAYPDHEFHRQGLESGAVAFLDKRNLDMPTLRQVIEDISN